MKIRISSARLALVVALAAVGSGCAHAQARVAPDPPALEIPAPPPRSVEAMASEVPQTVGSPETAPSGVDELNRAAVPRQTTRTPPSRPELARPVEAPKPDAPVEATKPPDDPRAQVPSPLQSASTQREAELEAAIRADLRRATDNLGRVNYGALGLDARGQYNSAKNYIQIAEQAVRARNLVYAKSVAEKASTLAAQLAGR